MTFPEPPRPRWWPLLLVLGIALAALVYIWTGDASQRQTRVMGTATTLFLTGFATTIWLLFLSRLRWKVRLGKICPESNLSKMATQSQPGG